MRESNTRFARIVTSGALAAVLILTLGSDTDAASCEGAAGYATVAIFVLKDAAGNPTLSRPPDVVIYKDPSPEENGRVCFVVRDLGRGQALAIAAKPVDQQEGGTAWKNPFPGLAPILARKEDRTSFASPRPTAIGRWKYALTLRKGEALLDQIDPVIIIDPGGGGNIGPGGGGDTLQP